MTLLPPDPTTPLAEAKVWLLERLAEGVRCPCCTQYAKEYVRRLNAGMAEALVRMYRTHGTDWQDKTETLRGVGPAARDESLLRHWGLLQEYGERREDGGHAWWWRVTALGEQFVLGRVTVPSHVRLYDNHYMGTQGGQVQIVDCLGQRFDFAELMAMQRAAS
jgi:hypothetical protein